MLGGSTAEDLAGRTLARVIGGSGEPMFRLMGDGPLGVLRNLNLTSLRDPGGAGSEQLIRVLDGGLWQIDDCDVRASNLFGFYAYTDGGVVEVNRLTGAGCPGGEIVITGENTTFTFSQVGTEAEPIYYNHEVQTIGAPPNTISFSGECWITNLQVASFLADVSVIGDGVNPIHVNRQINIGGIGTMDTTVRGALYTQDTPPAYVGNFFDIICPGVVRFEGCTLDTQMGLIRLQTVDRIIEVGQRIIFDGGSFTEAIAIRGIGRVDFDNGVAGPAVGDWLTIDGVAYGGQIPAVEIYVDTVLQTTLTGVGQSWSP